MSRPQQIYFKRGDTFLFSATVSDTAGSPINLTGWTIQAQVRNSGGTLIDAAVVTVTDAVNGTYTLTVADTTDWAINETYYFDIQYTDSGGIIRSTNTLLIAVVEDITR